MNTEELKGFEGWGIVELLGHCRIAGRVSTEKHFGAEMGRVDIPIPIVECKTCGGSGKGLPLGEGTKCLDCDGRGTLGGGFATQFFGGGSVYRFSPCSEEVARAVAMRNQPAPVQAWEMPKQLSHVREEDRDDDDRDY